MKTMNHTEYQKNLKHKSFAELHYILKDAQEAIKAMPDGINAGYYADEINYAAMELNRRKK
jgi:hypothetical protein